MPGNGIELRRTLHARRERVFAAWTRPELMARWLFPKADWTAVVAADFRVGGAWSVEMREPTGQVHHQFGVYREIEPVSRLVFTWTCPILNVADSVVTVALAERGDRTELVLTHVLPENPAIRHAHEEGWTGCLASLETFLQGDER
jgi:uncharacterized protein YndB with AHSA1/START domain